MADDATVTIRVSPTLRQNFKAALDKVDSTPTEYLRGAIQDLVKKVLPVPVVEKIDPVKIAQMVLRGDPLPDVLAPKPGFENSAATEEEANKVYLHLLANVVVKQDEILRKISGDVSRHFEGS